MAKKIIGIVIVVLIVAAAVGFISMRRSHMRESMSQVEVGNLHAVTADGTPIAAPASAGEVPENAAVQESDGLLVTFALTPYPPTGSQSTEFFVTLADSNGQPVSDASITLDMTMPGMWMPTNQPALEAGEPGQYSGSGIFTMRGLWRIEVIIERGGKTQSVFFDLGL